MHRTSQINTDPSHRSPMGREGRSAPPASVEPASREISRPRIGGEIDRLFEETVCLHDPRDDLQRRRAQFLSFIGDLIGLLCLIVMVAGLMFVGVVSQ